MRYTRAAREVGITPGRVSIGFGWEMKEGGNLKTCLSGCEGALCRQGELRLRRKGRVRCI